jgi:hypothetical protein
VSSLGPTPASIFPPTPASIFPTAHAMSTFASKMMTISGMQGAAVDIHPQHHHGIGAACYTQSTSPIRRFSDLLVQRQMKSALGFGDAIPAASVRASLERQNVVRGSIKRVERLLTRRAVLDVMRQQAAAADDAAKLLYHCVVLKSLPQGRGSPGSFGDFSSDTALLPPHVVAGLVTPPSSAPPVRCAWFMILIPALGALERCLLPLGTNSPNFNTVSQCLIHDFRHATRDLHKSRCSVRQHPVRPRRVRQSRRRVSFRRCVCKQLQRRRDGDVAGGLWRRAHEESHECT